MTRDAAAAACAHCGLPVPLRAGRNGEDPAFCCTGCFVAWHLAGSDLEGHTDRLLARLVLSALLSMGVMVFSLALYGPLVHEATPDLASDGAAAMTGLFRLGALALTAPIVLLLGVPHLRAVLALRRFLSADALILCGALSAFLVSAWNTFFGSGEVYFETAAMVLVLTTLGKWMDARARDRAREHLAPLVDDENPAALVPLVTDAPGPRSARLSELRPGDRVRVGPGEVVPVDGDVEAGRAAIDGSRLTGESEPRAVSLGERVLAGSRVLEGELTVTVRAGVGERVRDEMQRLLREALERRSPSVRLADRAAGVLLPAVLVLAAGTAVWTLPRAGLEEALMRALSVLLISCPCALGIATPLALWTALGAAWRRGVLVRGGDVLERLAGARRVLFDKTGTLTTGEVRLARVRTLDGSTETEALALSAAVEVGVEHPCARAVLRAWNEREAPESTAALPPVSARRTLPGTGVEVRLGDSTVRLVRAGARGPRESTARLEQGGRPIAELTFRSEARPEARAVLADLARRGLEPAILTGDAAEPARALAEELGVPALSELLPADKVAAIEAAGPRGVVFVGDGLNDSAALATADVGIAVAGASGASLRAAEVDLLTADLGLVPYLLDLARDAVRVARWNLAWAFAYNSVGLWLAVGGRLTPIFAASAMVASSAVVVLGSSRVGRSRPARPAREVAPRQVPAGQAAGG